MSCEELTSCLGYTKWERREVVYVCECVCLFDETEIVDGSQAVWHLSSIITGRSVTGPKAFGIIHQISTSPEMGGRRSWPR